MSSRVLYELLSQCFPQHFVTCMYIHVHVIIVVALSIIPAHQMEEARRSDLAAVGNATAI